MRTVSVSWDRERGRFVALGRHAGQQIAINAPSETGAERDPTGFSATELMLASAGACAAWDVVEILRKRRAQVAQLDVSVDATQDDDPPWTYRSVTLHFRVVCDGLTVPVMSRVIRLSMVRYCSVIATISGVAAIAATVELVQTAGTSTGRVPIELALPAAPLPPSSEPVADEDE
jgi:putative redox protein